VIVIAAILAAWSVFLFMKPLPASRRPRNRLSRLVDHESDQKVSQESAIPSGVLRLLGAAGGALVGWTFAGTLGLILGCGAGLYLIQGLQKREGKPANMRNIALARDTPIFIDLLAATLISGASMRNSLEAATSAMAESPVRDRLMPVLAAIDLGADPRDAWSALTGEPILGQLALSVMRSYDTGSGIEPVLVGIAGEMRREQRSRVEVAARTAGVKAVIPLAVCFLPGFFALGVVPIIASLAESTGFLTG